MILFDMQLVRDYREHHGINVLLQVPVDRERPAASR